MPSVLDRIAGRDRGNNQPPVMPKLEITQDAANKANLARRDAERRMQEAEEARQKQVAEQQASMAAQQKEIAQKQAETVAMRAQMAEQEKKDLAVREKQAADMSEKEAAALKEKQAAAILACAWDGSWWRRGFDDDGVAIGSSSCEYGKIWLNTQSWSVLAGVGFATAAQRLGTREGRHDLIVAGLLLFALVLLVAGYLGISLYQVWSTGRSDQARAVDAIVVMGAAQYDGRPSPQLAARLDHVVELWDRGLAVGVQEFVFGAKDHARSQQREVQRAGDRSPHSRGHAEERVVREDLRERCGLELRRPRSAARRLGCRPAHPWRCGMRPAESKKPAMRPA